jgi:hypothetical protein
LHWSCLHSHAAYKYPRHFIFFSLEKEYSQAHTHIFFSSYIYLSFGQKIRWKRSTTIVHFNFLNQVFYRRMLCEILDKTAWFSGQNYLLSNKNYVIFIWENGQRFWKYLFSVFLTILSLSNAKWIFLRFDDKLYAVTIRSKMRKANVSSNYDELIHDIGYHQIIGKFVLRRKVGFIQ